MFNFNLVSSLLMNRTKSSDHLSSVNTALVPCPRHVENVHQVQVHVEILLGLLGYIEIHHLVQCLGQVDGITRFMLMLSK